MPPFAGFSSPRRVCLLSVPTQLCRPPRSSCSQPPARGRRARRPGSPLHGCASLSCPRTPAPPPGALLGLPATICTGEGTPPPPAALCCALSPGEAAGGPLGELLGPSERALVRQILMLSRAPRGEWLDLQQRTELASSVASLLFILYSQTSLIQTYKTD